MSLPHKKRPYYFDLWKHFSQFKSMVFVPGPRQSGKSTFAQQLMQEYENHLYFNWDSGKDRQKFLENPYFFSNVERISSQKPLIIFDEIHKYSDWKNYLKGVYDEFHETYQFLKHGSGRLDLFLFEGHPGKAADGIFLGYAAASPGRSVFSALVSN